MVQSALEWLNNRLKDIRGDIWRATRQGRIEERVSAYLSLMDKGVEVSFPDDEEPAVVAALVVQFMRMIPEGIVNVRATAALCAARDNIAALSVIVSALSSPSRQLLARLFAHLERLSTESFADVFDLARSLASHQIARFPEEGDEDGQQGPGPEQLIMPFGTIIRNHVEIFGGDSYTGV